MTGVSALITREYGISFTQWIQLHPMIPTHNNILYSFHQSNTNMFTQRVNSLMHNVGLCTAPQDSNYQTLWPTMWVELQKGRTRKKGSELLQASRKVRPIQHICKSTTNYFIPHHTERSSKRGGGRGGGDIYRYSVGLFDVEYEVLYECHLVQSEDDLKSSSCHFSQDEEVEGDGINLEVTPRKVTNHHWTGACVRVSVSKYYTLNVILTHAVYHTHEQVEICGYHGPVVSIYMLVTCACTLTKNSCFLLRSAIIIIRPWL